MQKCVKDNSAHLNRLWWLWESNVSAFYRASHVVLWLYFGCLTVSRPVAMCEISLSETLTMWQTIKMSKCWHHLPHFPLPFSEATNQKQHSCLSSCTKPIVFILARAFAQQRRTKVTNNFPGSQHYMTNYHSTKRKNWKVWYMLTVDSCQAPLFPDILFPDVYRFSRITNVNPSHRTPKCRK